MLVVFYYNGTILKQLCLLSHRYAIRNIYKFMCFTGEVRWMIVPCNISMSIMSTIISTDEVFYVVFDQLETLVNFVVGLSLICFFLFCLFCYS